MFVKFVQKHFFVITSLISVIPIAFYVWHFRRLDISDNPEDWGVFGDYIGGVYGVLTTILLFFVGLQLGKREDKRKRKIKAIEEIIQQIGKIKNSKNKIQTIGKLQNLIYSNRVYFNDILFNQLTVLSDHYLEVCKEHKEMNEQLEDDVLKKLKKYYD